MTSLIEKLLKNSTVKETEMLTDSSIFAPKDFVNVGIPLIDVALSGRIDGGISPGMLMLAGPSRHFKSAFALILAKAFMDKYKDGILLFYDSEFGTPVSYFDSFGVDKDRVIHTPVKNIEELKHDIIVQLKDLSKKDKIIIIIDSIGNIASIKEVDDAAAGKSVADMTRAKQLKSLFRITTPYIKMLDIPIIAINHTYKELALFPKNIVSGGTGGMYSSDAVWIIGRQQDKDLKGLNGYHFIINIEKSRYVREKSKLPITVSFDGGVKKTSGLFDLALDMEYIALVKKGYYQRVDPKTGEFIGDGPIKTKNMINDDQMWKEIFAETDFAYKIHEKFSLLTNEDLVDKRFPNIDLSE